MVFPPSKFVGSPNGSFHEFSLLQFWLRPDLVPLKPVCHTGEIVYKIWRPLLSKRWRGNFDQIWLLSLSFLYIWNPQVLVLRGQILYALKWINAFPYLSSKLMVIIMKFMATIVMTMRTIMMMTTMTMMIIIMIFVLLESIHQLRQCNTSLGRHRMKLFPLTRYFVRWNSLWEII